MKKLISIVFVFIVFVTLNAQEFSAAVSVNYEKLVSFSQPYESSDTKVFETMKQALEDFVNGRRWSNLQIEEKERIPVAIGVNLTRRNSATSYDAQLNVQLRRPVFNSTYTTGLFNYVETKGFSFTYNENAPLEYDPNSYYSNLTSTIAYYLYIMLGIYFDSFGPDGGTPFYQQAAAIAQITASQFGNGSGWGPASDSKARYWFVENHTNNAYADLHQIYYLYHRMGLDRMTQNQDEARTQILHSLQMLVDLNKQKSNILSVRQFLDLKVDEIVSIFTPAPMQEKQAIYDVLYTVSPISVVKLKDWGIDKPSWKQ